MRKIKNFFKKDKDSKSDVKVEKTESIDASPIATPRTLEAFETDASKETTFLTLLSTDKPIYRPGETVYARGVILHSLTFKETDLKPEAHFKVFAPNGDNILTVRATIENSVVSAFYTIPPELAGGDYKLQLTYPYNQGFTGSEREFNIRAFRAPRLKTQLKFLQKAYGPGDTAIATLEVLRAEGGVPQSAIITAIATVDGTEVYRAPVSLDSVGTALITFTLPTSIVTGDGTLACKIQDGGVTETASKTIPISLSTMEIYIYPEGGDLISDVENRFYVEAFTKTKDPGDITGEVRNKKTQEVVAMVTTEHEGRGKSSFVPKEGEEYILHVVKPSGILNEIPFPASKSKGVVVKSNQDVFDKEVTVILIPAVTGKYRVVLSKKMLNLDTVEQDLTAKQSTGITLNSKGARGVLTVTIYLGTEPLAERLVFCKPQSSIQVELQVENQSYAPGDTVKLRVKTQVNGQSKSCNVGIQICDDSVLEMVEKRKQSPRLPAMALLEPEVDHLDDSEELLANDGYVDLLLGTQGWRRFLKSGESIKEERALGKHVAKVRQPRMDWLEDEECEFDDASESDCDDNEEEEEAPVRRRRGVDLRMKEGLEEEPMEEKEEAPMKEEAMQIEMPAAPQRDMELKQDKADKKEVMKEKEAPAKNMIMQEKAEAPAKKKKMKEEIPEEKKKIAMKEEAPMKKKMAMKEVEEEIDEDDMFRGDLDIIHDIEEHVEIQEVRREYAHKRGKRVLGERTDFTETVYWCANVVTNKNGEATVQFDLSDSITTFRVFADCFADTLLGTASVRFESKNPFYMEPKLPLEVTFGDSIAAPIALVNESKENLKGSIKATVVGTGAKLGSSDLGFALGKSDRQRKMLPIEVGQVAETAHIKVSALTDSVTRPLRIVPSGFPFAATGGGTLQANTSVKHTFSIPATAVANSFDTAVMVYSTPASSLTESLKAFITEPCGCFEQTSMTTYPLVMVLRYFTTHTGVDPKLIESANDKLGRGYKRLTSYECKKGGFEWFGSDPAHEALTAYGVLQFTEMSKVFPVDSDMLSRTTKWLLSRRDGKGGFLRSSQALDQFGGAPQDTTNAYICWALTEAGIDVTPEINAVKESVKSNGYKDSYLLALLATTLYRCKRTEEARFYAEHLAKLQDSATGMVKDAAATITMSGGTGKTIETTALAVLCWLHEDKFIENVEISMKFISKNCTGSGYGSTQSTVLALKAIVMYDELRSSPGCEGSVVVKLNGREVTSIGFDKKTTGTLEAPSFASEMKPGDYDLEIEMIEGGRMPYSFTINYFATQGLSSSECKFNLKTEISNKKINEGETCRMTVTVENKVDEVLPMTVAIVGVPGGLEVRHDQLKEFVKSESVAYYETKGRDIVFYWRYFGKKEKKELNVDLIAAVPGKYVGPASRAYLYYTNEHKVWQDGIAVEVTYK